jgi:translation elongation factor EF-1alpha
VHAWAAPCSTLLDTLIEHDGESEHSVSSQVKYFWIDVLCINQHGDAPGASRNNNNNSNNNTSTLDVVVIVVAVAVVAAARAVEVVVVAVAAAWWWWWWWWRSW